MVISAIASSGSVSSLELPFGGRDVATAGAPDATGAKTFACQALGRDASPNDAATAAATTSTAATSYPLANEWLAR